MIFSTLALALSVLLPSPSSPTPAHLSSAPTQDVRIERIPLKHAAAHDAQGLLRQLLQPKSRDGQNTGAAEAEPTNTLVADGRTNALLVRGSADWIAAVKEGVAVVDIMVEPAEMDNLTTRVITLQHAQAQNVERVILNVFGNNRVRDGGARATCDVHTNRVVLRSSDPELAAMARLVEELDKKPATSDPK